MLYVALWELTFITLAEEYGDFWFLLQESQQQQHSLMPNCLISLSFDRLPSIQIVVLGRPPAAQPFITVVAAYNQPHPRNFLPAIWSSLLSQGNLYVHRSFHFSNDEKEGRSHIKTFEDHIEGPPSQPI